VHLPQLVERHGARRHDHLRRLLRVHGRQGCEQRLLAEE